MYIRPHAFISALLAAWEAADYRVGVGDHLRIRQLLQNLPVGFDRHNLKTQLAPILARDKEQQAAFYTLFDKILGEVEALEVDTPRPEPPNPIENTPKMDSTTKWMIILSITCIVILIISFIYKNRPNFGTVKMDAEHGTLAEFNREKERQRIIDSINRAGIAGIDTNVVLSTNPYEHSPNLGTTPSKFDWRFGWQKAYMSPTKWTIFVFLASALLSIGWWWLRRQRKLILDYKPNEKPPYGWSLTIPKVERMGYDPVLAHTSGQMRKRSPVDIHRLDLPRTVQATILRGGVVDFKYQRSTRTHEYLLLIDSHTPQNHQAQLFDYLFRFYTKQEVLVERFFYDSDMRLCWNEQHKGGISLVALQQKYPEHRLVVMGTGLGLLNPVSGVLNRWAMVLDVWQLRTLITPRPIADWDKRENLLSEKFQILPATLKGVAALAETLETTEPIDYRLWQTYPNPDTEPLTIPDGLTPETLIELLKSEYTTYDKDGADDSLLRWLAACTVCPVLHWDWTLHVAQIVAKTQNTPLEALLTVENLFLLNRLSWFIEGKMPDDTRKILFSWLRQRDPVLLDAALIAWGDILNDEQNRPDPDSLAYEAYRVQFLFNQLQLQVPNRKAVLTELERLLPRHEDALVVAYLKDEPTEIDVFLPPHFRKFVVDTEGAIPKVKDWVKMAFWGLPLMFLLGLGIFMGYQKKAETYIVAVGIGQIASENAVKMLDFWQKTEYRTDSNYTILVTDTLLTKNTNHLVRIFNLLQNIEVDDEFILYVSGTDTLYLQVLTRWLSNYDAIRKIIISHSDLSFNRTFFRDSSDYLLNTTYFLSDANPNFTTLLLKGLKGKADADKDSLVTIQEAFSYTRVPTIGEEPTNKPVLMGNFDKNRPLSKLTIKADTTPKVAVNTPQNSEKSTNSSVDKIYATFLEFGYYGISLLVIVLAFVVRLRLNRSLKVFLAYLIIHLVLSLCSLYFEVKGLAVFGLMMNFSFLVDGALLAWFFYLIFLPPSKKARFVLIASVIFFLVFAFINWLMIKYSDYTFHFIHLYSFTLSAIVIGFLYKQKKQIERRHPLFWLNLGLATISVTPVLILFARLLFMTVNYSGISDIICLVFAIIGQIFIGIGYYYAQFSEEVKTKKAFDRKAVIALIIENRLKEAIEILLTTIESNERHKKLWYNEIVILSSQYNEFNKEKVRERGFISNEYYFLNKLKQALLDIINDLDIYEPTPSVSSSSNSLKNWLIIITLIGLVIGFAFYYYGNPQLLQGIQLYELVLIVLGVILGLVLTFVFIYTALKGKTNLKLLWGFIVPIVMIGYPTCRSMEFGPDVLKIGNLTNIINNDSLTTVTVTVLDRGKNVFNRGSLSMGVIFPEGEIEHESNLNKNGQAAFKNTMIGSKVQFFIINSENYQILNPSNEYIITKTNNKIELIVGIIGYRISGHVATSQGKPVSNVTVTMQNGSQVISTFETNDMGYFNFPIENMSVFDAKKATLIFSKSGYKTVTELISLETNKPITVYMRANK